MLNFRATAVLALALVVVSGCTPVSEAPVSSAGPTTSNPVVESRLPWVSRIPLTCDELISHADAASFLGVSEPELELHEQNFGEFSTAIVQGGGISCWWNGPVIGGDFAVGIFLNVLADGSAEFAQSDTHPQPDSVLDSIGPGSVITCNDDGHELDCRMSFDVDGYWVDFSFEALSTQRGSTVATDFGDALAARLRAAGPPGNPYVPDADIFGVGFTCAGLAGLWSALNPALSPDAIDLPFDGSWSDAAARKAGRLSCSWREDPYDLPASTVTDVEFALTPGGSWNFDAAVAEYGVDGSEAGDARSVDVEGAARVAGFTRDGACTLVVDIGGSLLDLTLVETVGLGSDPCATAATAVGLLRKP